MNFCSCKGGCSCKTCVCDAYCRFFDVLGNQNRLHILNSLRPGPKNVSEIIKATGLEQTAISHALKRLEEGNFVTAKREGKFRVYELNHSTIEPLLKLIERHIHT